MASVPGHIDADRMIGTMPTSAREQPLGRLAPQPSPVLPQGGEQLLAEHDVAVLAALAAADVHQHAPAVDVAELESNQLRSAHSGGVERHQQHPMEQAVGGIDQSGDLLLAQDARQSSRPLGVGRQAQVPGPPERLEIEEPQRRQTLAHGVVGELAIAKQVRLIAPNLVRSSRSGACWK